MMEWIRKNKNSILQIVVCIVLILPVLIVSTRNRPFADDYVYTCDMHRVFSEGGGIVDLLIESIRTDIHWYNTWQGLYSSALIMAFTPSVFGATYYEICTFLILGVILLFVIISVRCLGNTDRQAGNCSVPGTLSFSFFITAYIALCMPSATEGLFWYNGAVNYIPFTMAAIADTILVASLCFAEHTGRYKVRLGLSCLLSFVISGGNHVSSFAHLIMLTLLLLFFLPERKIKAVFPLGSGVLGFYLMYRAPGTAIRQNRLHGSTVSETIFRSGFHAVDVILSWVDLNYILMLIICVPFVMQFAKKTTFRVKKFHIFMMFVSMYITLSGMFSTVYYATSGFGAGRLKNAVWIMFTYYSILLEWLVLVFLIQKRMDRNYGLEELCFGQFKKQRIMIYVTACLVIFWNPGFSGTANGRACLRDLLNGNAEAFETEMDARIASYQNPEVTELFLAPLSEKASASVLYFTEYTTDANAWPNFTIANYYGKRVYLDNQK